MSLQRIKDLQEKKNSSEDDGHYPNKPTSEILHWCEVCFKISNKLSIQRLSENLDFCSKYWYDFFCGLYTVIVPQIKALNEAYFRRKDIVNKTFT